MSATGNEVVTLKQLKMAYDNNKTDDNNAVYFSVTNYWNAIIKISNTMFIFCFPDMFFGNVNKYYGWNMCEIASYSEMPSEVFMGFVTGYSYEDDVLVSGDIVLATMDISLMFVDGNQDFSFVYFNKVIYGAAYDSADNIILTFNLFPENGYIPKSEICDNEYNVHMSGACHVLSNNKKISRINIMLL